MRGQSLTDWICLLEPATQLLVQQKPTELCSARSFQKLNENLPGWTLNGICCLLECFIPHKMSLIVVCSELIEHAFKLFHGQCWVLLKPAYQNNRSESGLERAAANSLVISLWNHGKREGLCKPYCQAGLVQAGILCNLSLRSLYYCRMCCLHNCATQDNLSFGLRLFF